MTPALCRIPLSVLDLSPIVVGGSPADALRNSLDLARHAEAWGYHRYWVAEHHNMPGIASSATSVLIGYLAAGTSRIRVGAGGVMLPNHPPLVVAEQFGTLETLYPGRIDLGLGRAPGTDPLTARALRRSPLDVAERFPQEVQELQSYFGPPGAQPVRAIPGEGLRVPIWLLGSSDYSARLAAAMGLPFAFASHFAPHHLHTALTIYRESFEPSEALARPYAMVGANVVAADTDEEAARLFTTIQLRFLALRRGAVAPLDPPVESMEGRWTEAERQAVEPALRLAIHGSAATVERRLRAFIDETQADEVMITTNVYDHAARLRSYEIIAGFMGTL